jgi:hypothetical protein
MSHIHLFWLVSHRLYSTYMFVRNKKILVASAPLFVKSHFVRFLFLQFFKFSQNFVLLYDLCKGQLMIIVPKG